MAALTRANHNAWNFIKPEFLKLSLEKAYPLELYLYSLSNMVGNVVFEKRVLDGRGEVRAAVKQQAQRMSVAPHLAPANSRGKLHRRGQISSSASAKKKSDTRRETSSHAARDTTSIN